MLINDILFSNAALIGGLVTGLYINDRCTDMAFPR
jgi:hypothetical protein